MNEKFTSPHEIAQLNIEHYRSLLKTPLDEQTRLTVERLLAAEKAKLADLANLRGLLRGAVRPIAAAPMTTVSSGDSRAGAKTRKIDTDQRRFRAF